MRRLTCLALLAAISCSGTDAPDDAGAPTDAGLDDASDAGPALDAATADAATHDAGPSLPTSCEGACRDVGATIDIGGQQGGFQRAFYGLTAPTVSSSGEWRLHIEVLSGGEDACPSESSPAPDWNLILGSVPLPVDTAGLTGLGGSFLDFDGRFLGAVPVSSAQAVTVTPVAANVCTECVGQGAPSHPAGFVAFVVEATFESGTISGHVFATHCDSLDVAE